MEKPIKLWCDNLSVIAVGKNPSHHGKMKHIDVHFHFIRGLVTNGLIVLNHCSIDDQLADIFTKPLSVEKRVYLRRQLGLQMLRSRGYVEE